VRLVTHCDKKRRELDGRDEVGETTSYVAISPVATLVTATLTRYALFLSLLKPFMTNDTLPVPSVAVCSSEEGNFIHMAVPGTYVSDVAGDSVLNNQARAALTKFKRNYFK
jgi:hypothetical protein